MRALADIDREITETAARLNALHQERQDVRQAEIDAICRLFDAGMDPAQIAVQVKQGRPAVIGTLWRAGRTCKGRTAIKGRSVAFAHQQVSP